MEYANRWLEGRNLDKLSDYMGDNRYPFLAVNKKSENFIDTSDEVIWRIRENFLVSIVTVFEGYLFDVCERVLYLDPSILLDSDIKIDVKEIAQVAKDGDVRRWLAKTISQKYIRNKTHIEMMDRVGKLCQFTIKNEQKPLIEQWKKWSLVRNSIVHTSRQVTDELSQVWKDRFPDSGKRLNIVNEDIGGIINLSNKLASAIDKRAIASRIHKKDELLLAREIFVHFGLEKYNVILSKINKVMRTNIKKEEIEKMIAKMKNGVIEDHYDLSYYEISKIIRPDA